MPATDYTDKQLEEHTERFKKDGTLPENSIFDPAAHVRGEPVFRKMTPEELKAAGVTESPKKEQGGQS